MAGRSLFSIFNTLEPKPGALAQAIYDGNLPLATHLLLKGADPNDTLKTVLPPHLSMDNYSALACTIKALGKMPASKRMQADPKQFDAFGLHLLEKGAVFTADNAGQAILNGLDRTLSGMLDRGLRPTARL